MRTSGVKLVAETGDYKREMNDAADATDKAKDSIGDLAASAPKAKVGLDTVGRSAKGAGRDVSGFRRDLESLDRQIALTEAELLSLSRAFAKTGDKKIFGAIGDESGTLRQLSAIRKRITDAGDDSATGFFTRFSSKLGTAMQGLPVSPQIAAAVGGAALVAAPILGAVLSGAVIGGAGIGGVAGGLLLASKDFRVQQAADQMGERLEKRLDKAGGAFVNPAIAGIHIIEKSIDSINLEHIFADSSRLVVPLARGIGDAIASIGNGIEDLVAKAGPVIDVIGTGIASIGDHLGHGLSMLADNGADAAASLQLLFAVINSSLDSVFGLVDLLSKVYGLLNAIGGTGFLPLFARFFGPDMNSAAAAAQQTAVAAQLAAGGINRMGGAAAAAVPPVRDLDKAAADAAASQRSLYGATTDTATAVANAKKTIDENGKALSLNSAKGRENREALSGVASAMNRQHDAAVAANGEGRKSLTVSENNRAAFIRLAEKAGYSAGKARELASSLGLIPTRRETQIKVETSQAEANAKRIRSLLNQVHSKTVSVNVLVNEQRLIKVQRQLGDAAFRAGGGPVGEGRPYVVGEQRPEVFTPTMDGLIHASKAAFVAQHTAMATGGMIREPIFGVGRSGRTYSFGEQGVPEAVTPMNRTYQAGGSGPAGVTYVTNINLVAQLAAGANMREAGRQLAEQISSYLHAGGTINVRGTQVLP